MFFHIFGMTISKVTSYILLAIGLYIIQHIKGMLLKAVVAVLDVWC